MRELRDFYSLGSDVLWIVFHDRWLGGRSQSREAKARASRAVLDDDVDRFERAGICDRMFFVCHSPRATLAVPEPGSSCMKLTGRIPLLCSILFPLPGIC
jgi:hypothetical protein